MPPAAPPIRTLMPIRGTRRQADRYTRRWRPDDPPRRDAPTPKIVALLFPKLFWPQTPIQAPLPVLALAGNLRHHGYRVLVLDERVTEDAVDRLLAAGRDLLLIGISCHVGDQTRNGLSIARRLKRALPEVPIVIGGWFASIFTEALLEEPAVDVAVRGQGEAVLVELAAALARGESLATIPGIVYRDGTGLRSTGSRKLEDVNVFPPIAYDLVELERHLDVYHRVNFFTSRGCPGRCRFCGIFCAYQQGWTGLTPARVAHDIKTIQARCPQVEALEIVDTDFASDKGRTLGIARALNEAGVKARWKCSARILNLKDYAGAELDLLARAGCEEIEIGVESGSQKLLDVHRKDTRVDDVERTIRRLGEAGIRTRVNTILGCPGEEAADLRATFRLLQRLRRVRPRPLWSFYRYVPIPGTSLGTQTWALKRRGHGGRVPATLSEILDIKLPEEDQPLFWLGARQERRVRLAYFFYVRLAYYMDRRWGWSPRDLLYRFVLTPLALFRLRTGWYAWPFEIALNRRLGPELPPFM